MSDTKVNQTNARLLVVDDEENNRDMLSRRLQRAGFSVDSVAGGEEALAVIGKNEYDVVLMDQMMPDLTGTDVLRLLRATYSPEQLPVIMVTAVNESERIVEALSLGANDYVTKPVDLPVTLARINAQLARKSANAASRQREERQALAAKSSNEGLLDWDLQTNTIHYSSRLKEMLGFAHGEIGSSFDEWFARVPLSDRESLRSALETYWISHSSEPLEVGHRIVRNDGTSAWLLVRGLVVRDDNGKSVRMVGSCIDVTNLEAYDAVTGLPNRRYLEDWLEKRLGDQSYREQSHFGILLLELDRINTVNESLGYAAGDDLRRQIATRLREICGHDNVVARLGNRFAVLLQRATPDIALEKAEQLLESMRQPFLVRENEFVFNANAGVVIEDELYRTAGEVVRDAETALSLVKPQTGSRSALFSHSMRDDAMAQWQFEKDLQKAVERSELQDYYQPKVRLKTSQVVGFEALIRWQHPVLGLIPPCKFIPLAEENGVIIPLGRWVIRAACQQLKIWNKGRSFDQPLKISVNVSPKQFLDESLATFIRQTIADTGVHPGWLDLEVTESVLVEDVTKVASTLANLRSIGLGLKLDDFGIGYSALGYLRQLPFDTLKIDQSFTRELTKDTKTQDLVRTILSMARDLGMDVVAEGVETEAQAAILKLLGCEYGQGYLYSVPLPAKEAGLIL